MRSYTNSEGMLVNVTEEHLEKAVEIKLELQNMSPSRRISWRKHREMMEFEGFQNSDVSEQYRCLVKDYQRKVGKLPSAVKHADMVSTTKLESIRSLVGDIYQEKRENQGVLRELNKAKRDLADFYTIAADIREAMLDNVVIEVPHYVHQNRLAEGDNQGVLVVTDWHIGALVDNVHGNSYNYEIAKKRVEKLKEDALSYVKTFDINTLTVVFNGDAIEHLYMRPTNQPFETEFNMAQQINNFTRLFINLCVSLSEYCNVDIGMVAGNHDRTDGNKDKMVSNDNAITIIHEQVKTFIEMLGTKRLSIIDNSEYNYELTKCFNGSWIKFVHGDNERIADTNKISAHEFMDGREYKALVMGHFHRYSVAERNFGKFEIYTGSLMGRNDYARNFKGMSDASQSFILVRGDGQIVPIPLNLQIV
ncbi:metallophosphoesterase [Bacillus cereus]|uniref:metallophosphoesterase n=1 Tax=Bacillus thuringiensis TaxID=1428 RepID=UPI000B431C47|nr:metallophosphoesterase [Bacillus thuringiensis]MEB9467790.1 metallophosphoesterase [Bacillus cereus]OUA16676.1 hypothetical protein BK776_30430 [Bacillus thuringiensis serovar aizawai]